MQQKMSKDSFAKKETKYSSFESSVDVQSVFVVKGRFPVRSESGQFYNITYQNVVWR
jgi:hypothetical protein